MTNRFLLDARELKASVDLVQVAQRFTRLRRHGRQFVGLCPLHRETKPSFFVHPEKQVFKCFGCGAGGDVFQLVMCLTGSDFRTALEFVFVHAGGVACDSEPRSGSRLGASEGAKPLSPPKAGVHHSQSLLDSRALILASLDATNRRLRAIEETKDRYRLRQIDAPPTDVSLRWGNAEDELGKHRSERVV